MTDFGLIGHPVAHSMSKVMHEAAFKELGLGYTYGLFDVTEDKLCSFMAEAEFRGLNVTIPLKLPILKYMDRLSREAELIGSVNTVEFGEKTVGHNTDALGFIKSLEEAGVVVRGRKVLVIGAGGGGRGIVFKLALDGANVCCYNRDAKKAAALAEEVLRKTGVRVETPTAIAEAVGDVDVLVNATSVGMHPKVGESVVPKELLHEGLTVVDIVYNPLQTRLLREASEAGCTTVDGAGMLVHQGAESLRIWLRMKPPIEAMRAAVLRNLKGAV